MAVYEWEDKEITTGYYYDDYGDYKVWYRCEPYIDEKGGWEIKMKEKPQDANLVFFSQKTTILIKPPCAKTFFHIPNSTEGEVELCAGIKVTIEHPMVKYGLSLPKKYRQKGMFHRTQMYNLVIVKIKKGRYDDTPPTEVNEVPPEPKDSKAPTQINYKIKSKLKCAKVFGDIANDCGKIFEIE